MAVRRTEGRLPQIPGFVLDDLGQNAASGTNAAIKIVSYLSSPLGLNIRQNYVVFVEDAAVQPNVASYEWTFNDNGTITTNTTTNGVQSFTPNQIGPLSVTVNLRDNANATLHTVVLQQQVVALNLELEQLIVQEGNNSPTAGNPTVTREIINGLRIYADAVASPVTDNALNRLILCLAYSNISANTAAQRNTTLENCSAALQANPDTFFNTAQNGIGITKLRPHLAAMFITDGGPLIPVTERPTNATGAQITANTTAIRAAFNGLTDLRRIDIFNLLRFPKSNLKICKLVLDGLKGRYFAAEAFSAVLGNRTKARRVIREFEIGPYAIPAAGTGDLTATSTAIFNLMLLAVWRISVSASTNPGGTIDPQTRVFGIAERIPENTYMANFGLFPGDEQFIRSARAYHDNFNISFTNIVSLEEIIDDLQASSTPFHHFRIFTHANEGLLGISLFRGGAGFVQKEHLDGFATSEFEGVKAILGIHFPGAGGFFFGNDMADNFLHFLQAQNSPALVPFHLDVAGAVLSPELRELFRRYMDVWLMNIPGSIRVITGAAQRNITPPERADPFIPFLDLIATLFKPTVTASIAGLTDAHFVALRAAILAVTPVDLGFANNAVVPFSWPVNNNPFPDDLFPSMVREFRSTVRALPPGNNFLARLTHVKNNRFDANTFLDIRGCLAGKLPFGVAPPPPLLVSVQRFFGRAGALPTVTAPEWFQSFQANFRNDPRANNVAVDNLFNNGFNVGGIQLNAADITANFDMWRQLSNVDEQFLFFTNLFPAAPNLVEFASLRWRTWRAQGSVVGIPPLNLYALRADDMVQLQLGDLLNRLRENFSAAGANLLPAVVTRLNAVQPKIEDLIRNEEQLAAFGGADFTTFYNDLSALATQITTIAGMPAPGAPLVDAVKPAPLNRAHITGYHGNIRAYLNNTALPPDINPIFTSIRNAIAAPDAKRHYYFNIRLPLRVQTAAGNNVQYVVFYASGAAADAIKSYMKCQWKGTPAQISDMHTFIDARPIVDGNGSDFLETAILVESEVGAIPNVVAPLPDYNSHIRST